MYSFFLLTNEKTTANEQWLFRKIERTNDFVHYQSAFKDKHYLQILTDNIFIPSIHY